MNSIRILVADDQPVVRSGLRMILEGHQDLALVAEAGDGRAAVRLAQEHAPDVVLMDIRMPGLDGIAATRALAESGSDSRVLVLTTYDPDEYVYEALAAGASGFLLKTDSPQRLLEGIRAVYAGESLFTPTVTRRLVERYVETPPPRDPREAVPLLTQREIDVLLAVAEGLSNAEIAGRLYIGEGTVKTHVARILAKHRLRDRVQAVVLAYETGLVRPRGEPPG
ncbi:DNA-binding NarL/FixJ family response regulator [Kribbella antiqua]|uniref:DNA-binding NarL/FixJ family response regulator n=1 Tax=Kribbella antiqua TaxID=2512217 RepID=A0A4R2IV39_9ACTN|nr:response regulator transcription factor [Kribbella antiqua]TCO49433.1 DNA-binding NarL/FixJ family response regulator [Kribbella antiqua]